MKPENKVTDPYCPSVGATLSEDIPLIIKSSQEFPARSDGVGGGTGANEQFRHSLRPVTQRSRNKLHCCYTERLPSATR